MTTKIQVLYKLTHAIDYKLLVESHELLDNLC